MLIFFPFNSLEKAISAGTESISISSISDMLIVWLVLELSGGFFGRFSLEDGSSLADWVDVTWKTRLGKREEQLKSEPPGKLPITRAPAATSPRPLQHSKLLPNSIFNAPDSYQLVARPLIPPAPASTEPTVFHDAGSSFQSSRDSTQELTLSFPGLPFLVPRRHRVARHR